MKFKACCIITLLCTCLFFQSGHSQVSSAFTKIAILAGYKSHPPGYHEYIKSARLIKTLLDKHTNYPLQIAIYHDWPGDANVLDDVKLIISISDGRDGDLFTDAVHLVPERFPVIEKQMQRGCGLVSIHFSTFAPDKYGNKILEWNGGYFDWEDDNGTRNWYSAIRNLNAEVQLTSPEHAISRGVKTFQLEEEFYYNIRFPEKKNGWAPILAVPALGSERVHGNVVAWAKERADGGRGFGTTMGHHFANWQNDDFRKLILNGIIWAAGLEVPAMGVASQMYTDKEVTRHLFRKSRKALILTGDNIEAHEWDKTTCALQELLEDKTPFHVDISTDIEDLGEYSLNDYDLLILNYCNWNRPQPLSDASKNAFTSYLDGGGGLMILHFSNGAFHYSLPKAATSDWPEYRKICRRVWDHHGNSAHDAYGNFKVQIQNKKHPVTKGLKDFDTTDELYFNQKGTEPIEILATAVSKVTGKAEPMAWHYAYGNGKVFQTVLGHNQQSYSSEGFRKLLVQAAIWTAKQ